MKTCSVCSVLHARGHAIGAYWKFESLDAAALQTCSRVERHARDLLAADLRPVSAGAPYDLAHVHYSNLGASLSVPPGDDADDEPDEGWIGQRDADLQVWAPRWYWCVQRAMLPNAPLHAVESAGRRPADVLHLPADVADHVLDTERMTRWWRAVLGAMDGEHQAAACAAHDLGGPRAVRELLFGLGARPGVLRAVEAAP